MELNRIDLSNYLLSLAQSMEANFLYDNKKNLFSRVKFVTQNVHDSQSKSLKNDE